MICTINFFYKNIDNFFFKKDKNIIFIFNFKKRFSLFGCGLTRNNICLVFFHKLSCIKISQRSIIE